MSKNKQNRPSIFNRIAKVFDRIGKVFNPPEKEMEISSPTDFKKMTNQAVKKAQDPLIELSDKQLEALREGTAPEAEIDSTNNQAVKKAQDPLIELAEKQRAALREGMASEAKVDSTEITKETLEAAFREAVNAPAGKGGNSVREVFTNLLTKSSLQVASDFMKSNLSFISKTPIEHATLFSSPIVASLEKKMIKKGSYLDAINQAKEKVNSEKAAKEKQETETKARKAEESKEIAKEEQSILNILIDEPTTVRNPKIEHGILPPDRPKLQKTEASKDLNGNETRKKEAAEALARDPLEIAKKKLLAALEKPKFNIAEASKAAGEFESAGGDLLKMNLNRGTQAFDMLNQVLLPHRVKQKEALVELGAKALLAQEEHATYNTNRLYEASNKAQTAYGNALAEFGSYPEDLDARIDSKKTIMAKEMQRKFAEAEKPLFELNAKAQLAQENHARNPSDPKLYKANIDAQKVYSKALAEFDKEFGRNPDDIFDRVNSRKLELAEAKLLGILQDKSSKEADIKNAGEVYVDMGGKMEGINEKLPKASLVTKSNLANLEGHISVRQSAKQEVIKDIKEPAPEKQSGKASEIRAKMQEKLQANKQTPKAVHPYGSIPGQTRRNDIEIGGHRKGKQEQEQTSFADKVGASKNKAPSAKERREDWIKRTEESKNNKGKNGPAIGG